MNSRSAKVRGKDLLAWMRKTGMDEYGAVMLGETVRGVIGIQYPDTGTKQEFDAVSLMELASVDYARNVLLGEGKYLAQNGGNYRILLPSENVRQVHQYMASADSKLKRALKLSRNTPNVDTEAGDNTQARILLKRDAIKRSSVLGRQEG